MRNLLTAIPLLLLLTSCVSIGPSVSYTKDLGYARPAIGITAQIQSSNGRVELSGLAVEKLGGGGGYALAYNALFNVTGHNKFRLLFGVDGVQQTVKKYSTNRTSPRIEAGYELQAPYPSIAAFWIGPDRKIRSVYGLRIGGPRITFELARVVHTQGTGNRAGMFYLWRFR